MLDRAFDAHGDIVDFWKFFVPSTMAMIGWVFARREPWPWTQRGVVAIGFLGFAVMNLLGLIKSYALLGVLIRELGASRETFDLTPAALRATIHRLDLGGSWRPGIAFHVLIDLAVLYFILIWSGKTQKSESHPFGGAAVGSGAKASGT